MLLWAAEQETKHGRAAQAAAFAEQAVAVAPRRVDAWALRIQLTPQNAEAILAEARSLLDEGTFLLVCAEAADVLKLPADPVSPEKRRLFVQARIRTLALRGRRSEADEALAKFAADPQTRPDDAAWANRNRAMLAAARGSVAERKQAIEQLKEWKPDAATPIEELRSRAAALTLAARHLYGAERKQGLQQALAAMKLAVESKEAQPKDWFALAQLQILLGDRAGQLEALKEAMKRDGGNLFYAVVVAEELLADGKRAEASPLVAKLTEATHDVRAADIAARYHCLGDNAGKAIEIIDRFAQSVDPGTPDGLARQRQAVEILDRLARLAVQKDLGCGRKLMDSAFDRYRSLARANPEAVASHAALLAFDGKAAEAFDLLAAARNQLTPKALAAAGMGVIRNGSVSARHFQIVMGWIGEALAVDPSNLTLRLSLAELHALQQEYSAAEPIYREVLKAEPENVVAFEQPGVDSRAAAGNRRGGDAVRGKGN